jgi:hypothetical protein
VVHLSQGTPQKDDLTAVLIKRLASEATTKPSHDLPEAVKSILDSEGI